MVECRTPEREMSLRLDIKTMGSFKFKDGFAVCYCRSINHRVFFAPSCMIQTDI